MKKARLRANDRITIIGKTGTGKTTLAKSIMRGFKNLKCIVINPKNEPSLRRYFEDWPNCEHVVPKPGDMDEINERLMKVFQQGRALLYIDELKMIATHNNFPQALQYIYEQGRARGIGVIAVTQKPRRIPTFVLDNSEHIFSYRLKRPDDRRLIGAAAGLELEDLIGDLEDYHFVYASDRANDPVLCQPISA